MENNNDFIQKFDYSNKPNNLNLFSALLISFVSAVVGAICALFIYFNSIAPIKTVDTQAFISDNTNQKDNLNLSQVSLSAYSDTAIYAANKVLPSMVSISVEYEVSYFGRTQTSQAAGSGIIINENGYILTNNHVIDSAGSSYYKVTDATSIIVTIYGDDTEYKAEVVGKDSQTDLAVLKIDKTGLTAAEFGVSNSILVGEFVLAIGNSYGLEYSVTSGIVSALDREMTVDNTVYNVIQADCAINSGNSGGALVNSKGQVIGVTTLKIAGNSIEGLSFAIPISDALPICQELIENGKISRPYLGISGIDVDKMSVNNTGFVKGIYVDGVIAGGSAEQAGIQKGDIIVKFDNVFITNMDELNEIKNSKKPGDTVDITIYRNKEEKTITVTLGEQ